MLDPARIVAAPLAFVLVFFVACGNGGGTPATPTARPIPSPVPVRQQPEGITILTDDAAGRAYADSLRPILEGPGD